MRETSPLVFTGMGVLMLLFAGCTKRSPVSGSGGSSGPTGTAGSTGRILDAGTSSASIPISDASPGFDLAGSIDAEDYASLDGPSGCGLGFAPAGVLDNESITVGGRARTYVFSVPKNYDPSTPLALVFAWHGHGLTGFQARQSYALEPAAAGGAIFVYPDGIAGDWDYSATSIDVDLFDALVSHVVSHYCIDRNRIFSTGLSAGAYFTNLLGCRRGNVLRAIAPVAGGLPTTTSCVGKVGAWVAHASNDGQVDFTTNGLVTRDFWASRNGCSMLLAPLAVSPGDCVEYQGCLSDLPVVWCVYGEGHVWPMMANCQDGGACFDAGPAIWAFFARFK